MQLVQPTSGGPSQRRIWAPYKIKRRTNLAGIFSNASVITRPVGATLREPSDEQAAQRARHPTPVTAASIADDVAISSPAEAT
jgi:hypothetical protein